MHAWRGYDMLKPQLDEADRCWLLFGKSHKADLRPGGHYYDRTNTEDGINNSDIYEIQKYLSHWNRHCKITKFH